MPFLRVLPAVLGITLALACGGERTGSSAASGATAPVRWQLSAEPVLEIGVTAGEEAYQLTDVVGAVRLSDGSIVVANDGTKEVRFFGGDGRFLRSFGRAGSGPEEFGRLYSLGALEGDTLLVVDGSRRRFVRVTAAGELARADPWPEGEIFPGSDWMAWRTVVRSARPGVGRAAVSAALANLPAVEGEGYRYVRVSADERIWSTHVGTRTVPSDSLHWAVDDLQGRHVAEVTTPPRFVLHDSGPDWILGVWEDDLGVEFVHLYEIAGVEGSSASPERQPAAGSGPSFTPVASPGMTGRDAPLRRLAILQETFYSNRMTYSASLDSLNLLGDRIELPEGLELAILAAEATGWMGQTRDRASGTTCLINMMAAGWLRLTTPPGFVACWSPDSTVASPAP